MTAWWSGLSTREQWLIAAAIALGGLLLATQLIVRPLTNWSAAAKQRAEQAESGYRLVAQAAGAALPSAGSDAVAAPARNALLDTARRMNVNLNFVNEHPDGTIEFQAGPVEPERAFALFAALQSESSVRVVAADVARSPETPQQVRVQATVSR